MTECTDGHEWKPIIYERAYVGAICIREDCNASLSEAETEDMLNVAEKLKSQMSKAMITEREILSAAEDFLQGVTND